jgi:hypothetical protein
LWLSHNSNGNVPGIRTQQGFKIVRVADSVKSTHNKDGGIVLDTLHGQIFRLNLVGSKILKLLEHGRTQSEITQELASEFGIELARAEVDVREFVETLEKHHLLTARNRDPLP